MVIQNKIKQNNNKIKEILNQLFLALEFHVIKKAKFIRLWHAMHSSHIFPKIDRERERERQRDIFVCVRESEKVRVR